MVTNKGAITKVGFGKILHKKSVILSLERPKITLFFEFPKSFIVHFDSRETLLLQPLYLLVF